MAALEEDERRQVVLAVQEIGLLRVIRDARITVKRYKQGQMGGRYAPVKAAVRTGRRK